jgi:hypothetical protein
MAAAKLMTWSIKLIFSEMSDFATRIHANRLAGLYVDDSDQGLKIPARAISPEQAQTLIDLANALLKIAENEKPREDIPQEETELQAWLLAAFDDPERRKYILTTTSFAKLKELQDVRAWTLWIKSEIERSEAELQALAQREIQRGFESPVTGRKDKWKIELRIETHSHSIRPAPLKSWNAAVHRIKLTPVQRGRVKNELLVELILGEEVPIQGMWGLGLSMANLFIIGLNMATSGFWWWVLPRHKTRYYEKIYDLEHKAIVQIDGANLNIFYDRRPALNDTNIQSLIQCLSSLPGPDEQDRAPAYHFYLGGLTFLSINDIHWRCEAHAFGNFLQSLKLLMIEARFPHHSDEPWDQIIGRFLKEKYSDLEPTEHEAFVKLVGVFEGHVREPVAVKPVDVFDEAPLRDHFPRYDCPCRFGREKQDPPRVDGGTFCVIFQNRVGCALMATTTGSAAPFGLPVCYTGAISTKKPLSREEFADRLPDRGGPTGGATHGRPGAAAGDPHAERILRAAAARRQAEVTARRR